MFNYPQKLDKIFNKLIANDAKVIIVGGYVRDKILDIASLDIDIEIYNITSFEKLQKLLEEFGNVNNVGKSFGVCKLDFEGYKLDFTLPRIDNKTSSGHTGFKIEIDANLTYEEASSRRDFTINTMGYDVSKKKMLDPFYGVQDLNNKLLKVVDEQKFVQDPLRILRAMQFCARFELKPDTKLITLCKNMCQNNILQELPNERIFEEFNKLFLKASKPSLGLEFLKAVDNFSFFTELNMDKREWDFTLKALDACKKDIIIRLAVLCYKMYHVESFIAKLTNQKNILNQIKKYHHVAKALSTSSLNLQYAILKDTNFDNLSIFLKAINVSTKNLQTIKPTIHGKDLVKVGFKPSSEFSKLLQLIYEIQLISTATNRNYC